MGHDPRGPACSAKWPGKEPQGPGGTLIRQLGGRLLGVRPLLPQEVWKVQGGHQAEWDALPEGKEQEALRGAVQALPRRTAETCLKWAAEAMSNIGKGDKSGVCHDPIEASSWQAVLRWLRAWKASPSRPAAALEPGDLAPHLAAGTFIFLVPAGRRASAAAPEPGDLAQHLAPAPGPGIWPQHLDPHLSIYPPHLPSHVAFQVLLQP